MESFSPTNAFIRVDFPTLGYPIILTKPALWDMLFVSNSICKETKKGRQLTDSLLFPCSGGSIRTGVRLRRIWARAHLFCSEQVLCLFLISEIFLFPLLLFWNQILRKKQWSKVWIFWYSLYVIIHYEKGTFFQGCWCTRCKFCCIF